MKIIKDDLRYCGSCKRASHGEVYIQCEWLFNHMLDKKCPEESEESYRSRLRELELCVNCKEKLEWGDFYIGYCRKCETKIE